MTVSTIYCIISSVSFPKMLPMVGFSTCSGFFIFLYATPWVLPCWGVWFLMGRGLCTTMWLPTSGLGWWDTSEQSGHLRGTGSTGYGLGPPRGSLAESCIWNWGTIKSQERYQIHAAEDSPHQWIGSYLREDSPCMHSETRRGLFAEWVTQTRTDSLNSLTR